MNVERLTASGVRNLEPLLLEPRARFNVFVGNNGQGKTNLLEAIYVVSTLRSFRTTRLTDIIGFGAAQANLGARVCKQDLSRVYAVELAPGVRRVAIDGRPIRPISRYFGGFNVVVFTPEDLALPRGAPSDRRRFLDRAVFNRSPEHLVAMQDYDKALKQRNAVLKRAAQGMPRSQLDELLNVYDQQLAVLGSAVSRARAEYVAAIGPGMTQAFAAITRTQRSIDVTYSSKTADLAVSAIEAHLRDTRSRDIATETTQSGPHRDDLSFELEARAAGGFASQGQLRAIMLAWKTAELALLSARHGDLPILLLDDVSSELDPDRNEYLFEHLANQAGQCFITTTSAHHVLLTRDRADYRIENGRIYS